MTTEVRYIFGDALTGAVLDEIPMQGVNIADGIDGGDLQGTFGLNQTGRDNSDLFGATTPGKTYVVAERNGLPIFGGIVWSRTYQSQSENVQLYARTYDQYPVKRLIDTDLTFTATDPRNIMRELYNLMQADPHSIRVDVPSAFTTLTTVDLTVPGSELKSYRTVMDQIAAGNFEWRIAIKRENGVYTKTLVIGQPTVGLGISDTNPTFEYPGNVLNFWRNDTIASSGTNIYGIGAGEGENMGIVEVQHDDLYTYNWPRLDADVVRKDIEDLDLLQRVTIEQAAILKAPSAIYTVEMKADREPEFGEWGVGDYCNLVLNSAAGLVNVKKRIINFTYTPPSSEAPEEVRLTFEGDDLAS